MAESSSAPPASTFVVRFWREGSAGRTRWRGHITHVQSGNNAPFLDLGSVLDFVRGFGVMAEGEGQAAEKGEGIP